MKSRKVKAYNAQKRLKSDLPLDENDSDVNSDDFFHDEIDDLNKAKDDELSTDDELIQHREESSEEEEVLPITDDEKDDSEDNLEDEERDLPNREAWGKKKSAYYSADFVDEDRGRTYREEDAEAAKAEAAEAFAIQKSVYSNINADNLGANLFLEGSDESSGDEEKVDPKSLATKEEKLKYLRTETLVPQVCKDIKTTLQELKKFDKLAKLVESQRIKSEEFKKYIEVKNQTLNLLLLNLTLYMTFTSSGQNMKYHPVVQRISFFKQVLEDLKTADNDVAHVIDKILENYENENMCVIELPLKPGTQPVKHIEKTIRNSVEKDTVKVTNKEKKVKKNKVKNKVKHIETEAEKEVKSLFNEMKKRKLEERNENHEENDDDNNKHVEKDTVKITNKEKKVKKNKVKHIETEAEKDVKSLINEKKKRKLEERNEEHEENDDDNNKHVDKDIVKITNKEKKVKKNKVKHIETEAEKEVKSLIREMKKEWKKRKLEETEERKKRKLEERDEDHEENDDDNNKQCDNEDESTFAQDENGDDKRFINYQIAKNKGLGARRKKEQRNPRVHLRMKYRKAQIRRKGQVRGVYKEIKRYEGEPTGISANVVKSRKFK